MYYQQMKTVVIVVIDKDKEKINREIKFEIDLCIENKNHVKELMKFNLEEPNDCWAGLSFACEVTHIKYRVDIMYQKSSEDDYPLYRIRVHNLKTFDFHIHNDLTREMLRNVLMNMSYLLDKELVKKEAFNPTEKREDNE